MLSHAYPILEYDETPVALINPIDFAAEEKLSSNKLVICFFPKVITTLLEEGKIFLEMTIDGENPIELYRFTDAPVYLTLGFVGCPACGGNLDMFHAMGIDFVMFCGGGGVLDTGIAPGHILLVDAAIRDEGFSYHYLTPSRTVEANPETNRLIAAYLDAHNVPYSRGLVWTTDALFRETKERIQKRKLEGARIVEMEQAGCLAVSKHRGFAYGALIYGGDDVSSETWDNRDWRGHTGIRYNLVLLCKDLVCELEKK